MYILLKSNNHTYSFEIFQMLFSYIPKLRFSCISRPNFSFANSSGLISSHSWSAEIWNVFMYISYLKLLRTELSMQNHHDAITASVVLSWQMPANTVKFVIEDLLFNFWAFWAVLYLSFYLIKVKNFAIFLVLYRIVLRIRRPLLEDDFEHETRNLKKMEILLHKNLTTLYIRRNFFFPNMI